MTGQGGEALELALGLLRAPALRSALRRRPLPDGIAEVLAIASESSEATREASTRTGRPASELVEAARFFIQQVLLADGADAYRSLGAMPDAMILCHQPSRKCFRPEGVLPLPELPMVVRQYEDLMEFYKAPKSVEDMVGARDAIAEWQRITYGWMGRSPDYKAAFLGTLGGNIGVGVPQTSTAAQAGVQVRHVRRISLLGADRLALARDVLVGGQRHAGGVLRRHVRVMAQRRERRGVVDLAARLGLGLGRDHAHVAGLGLLELRLVGVVGGRDRRPRCRPG